MKSQDKNLLTKEQFACIIGKTVRTVERYIKLGYIETAKVRNRVYVVSELDHQTTSPLSSKSIA